MRKYIDREAAQKIVCFFCGVCQNPTLETLMKCKICPGFAKIPVEDVYHVVHGKWIHRKEVEREDVADIMTGLYYDKWTCNK